MTPELTSKERAKLTRIANKLYKEGVIDEHRAAAFYRRMSKELLELGFEIESNAFLIIAGSEEVHKDILNEIIGNIEEQVILSSFKKVTVLKGDFRPSRRRI